MNTYNATATDGRRIPNISSAQGQVTQSRDFCTGSPLCPRNSVVPRYLQRGRRL